MSSFIDMLGERHELTITLAHRALIKNRTGWDLVELAHKPERLQALLEALQADDDLLWQILSVLTGKSAAALLAAADGSTLEDASAALLEAITDFFPASSPLRRPLVNLWRQLQQTRQQAAGAIEEQLTAAVNRLDIASVISGSALSTSGSGDYQQSPQATG